MPAGGWWLPLITQGLGQHVHSPYYETSMGNVNGLGPGRFEPVLRPPSLTQASSRPNSP